MVDIQSKEVIDKISDELKVQPAMEIPTKIAKEIQLVYDISPRNSVLIVKQGDRATSGSTTVHTAHATRDTYLTGLQFSWDFDATADNLQATIKITPEGKGSVEIVNIKKLTTTANQGSTQLHINPPILLEKATTITLNSTFTVGAGTMSGTALMYETDPQ